MQPPACAPICLDHRASHGAVKTAAIQPYFVCNFKEGYSSLPGFCGYTGISYITRAVRPLLAAGSQPSLRLVRGVPARPAPQEDNTPQLYGFQVTL